MIFIIDSGSTKSDWLLLDGSEEQRSFSTIGFNPYFHTSEFIAEKISEDKELLKLANQVGQVFFYGAGCSSDALNKIVELGFKTVFRNAIVVVDHDLKACAYSTYTGKPSISCIIGTGSNSCFFDGQNVTEVVPALGYILGDEGSGSFYGKQLLADFLYHQMPKDILLKFEKEYRFTKEMIVEKVYKQNDANVFLASLSKFISKNHDHNYCKEMVFQGMKKFMEVHVCCYANFREVETHFIGSIAFVFQKELKRAASELGVNVGRIIQKPIDGLVEYHLDYILQTKKKAI